MNRLHLILALVLMVPGIWGLAQEGQNQPIYDPQDPIGRVLPPNLYFVLDVSGSMSTLPAGQGSGLDVWGVGTTTPLLGESDGDSVAGINSSMDIVKAAIYSLVNYESLKVRWSLFTYTAGGDTYDTRSYLLNNNIRYAPRLLYYSQKVTLSRQNLNSGSLLRGRYADYYYGRHYFERGRIVENLGRGEYLIRWEYQGYYDSNGNWRTVNDLSEPFQAGTIYYYDGRWRSATLSNPEIMYQNLQTLRGSDCTTSYSSIHDKLLVGPPRNAADPTDYDQWFATSLHPQYGNARQIQEWVDKKMPTVADPINGSVQFDSWSRPFLKEVTANGSTPIELSLTGVSRFTHGQYQRGTSFYSNTPLHGIDYDTGQWRTWTPEKDVDPYFDCRIHNCLLLTDGVDTCTGQSRAVQQAGIMKNTFGINTWVIGFGDQSSSEIAALNDIAAAGGTDYALFADNLGDLLYAVNNILARLPSTEISGDTEPVLGYIDPETPPDGGWPMAMPGDAAGEKKVLVQNIMVNASLSYSPVFKGHLRMFQAVTERPGYDDQIEFLSDFSRNSTNLIFDFSEVLEDNLSKQNYNRNVWTHMGGAKVSFVTNNRNTFKTAGLSAISTALMDEYIQWVRFQPLGPITYSTPVFVAPPPKDAYNAPDYKVFAENNETRKNMVLVGANDGMLHCFDASNGEELWSFIPPVFLEDTLVDNAFNDRDSDVTGVAKPRLFMQVFAEGNGERQGQPDVYGTRVYNRRPHYYFVAASPRVIEARSSSGTWHTLLVFGTGGFVNEYYCLDITDPLSPQLMWRFNDADVGADEVLGEAWSTPALGRFATTDPDYLLGRFCAVFGSGFNLNPAWSNAEKRGKSLYVVDIFTGTKLTAWTLPDTSQTSFGANPTSLVSTVGNCIFSDPVLWEPPSTADGKTDVIYFGDYQGKLYRATVDLDNTASKIAVEHIFTSKNGTPMYSGVFPAELQLPGSAKQTYLTFAEYGSPVDPLLSGNQLNPAIYVLVEDLLPTGRAATVSDLAQVSADGQSCSFNPATSAGFYQELDRTKLESVPFRPAIFWNEKYQRYWVAATSYQFKPSGGGTTVCDPATHTVGGGQSFAYIYNLQTGVYFNSVPVPLGSGTVFYGRASGFHKGLRGEGWIDIGTGETWGWGYSQTQDKFTSFQDPNSSDQRYAEKNPTFDMRLHKYYWREFK